MPHKPNHPPHLLLLLLLHAPLALHAQDIIGTGSPASIEFFRAFGLAHQLTQQDTSTYHSSNSEAGYCALTGDFSLFDSCNKSMQYVPTAVDFAFVDFVAEEEVFDRFPDLQVYPMLGSGLVPIYNLGPNISNLIIPLPTLAKIFTGQITSWRDQSIVDANRNLEIPDISLRVCVRADSSGITAMFKRALKTSWKFFDDFVPLGPESVWTRNASQPLPENFLSASGSLGPVALVALNVGVITYEAFPFSLFATQAKLGDAALLKRESGSVVSASIDTIQGAVTEISFGFDINFSNNSRLVAADSMSVLGDSSWPLVGLSYVAMRKHALLKGRTCANKNSTLGFFMDLYRNDTVEVLLPENYLAFLPLPMRNLIAQRMADDLKCDGKPLRMPENRPRVVFFGPQVFTSLMLVATSVGTALRPHLDLEFVPTKMSKFNPSNVTATILRSNNTIVNVVVAPNQVYEAGILSLPFVAVVYTFATNIPNLPPVVLSPNVVARVFSNNSVRWNDPEIVALNPSFRDHSDLIVPFLPDSQDHIAALTRFAQLADKNFVLRVKPQGDDLQVLGTIVVVPNSLCMASSNYLTFASGSVNVAEIVINGTIVRPSNRALDACFAAKPTQPCFPLYHEFYLSMKKHYDDCTEPGAAAEAAWFVNEMFRSAFDVPSEGIYPLSRSNKAVADQLDTLACGEECLLCAEPNTHSISQAHWILADTLASVVIAIGLAVGVWVIMSKNLPVVQHAQPLFLLLTLFGCLITASTVLVAPVNGKYARDTGEAIPDKTLDLRCSLQLWFYVIGTTLMFTSLFAKLWRVKRIFDESRGTMTRVSVKTKDVLPIVIGGLAVSVGTMTCWQVFGAIHWHVRVLNYDSFGRVTESKAECHSSIELPMAVAVVSLYLVMLGFGNWVCYTCREIPFQFAEVKWITYALFSWFHSLALATPVLVLLHDDPVSQFALKWLVSLFQATCVLIYLFFPKLWVWWTTRNKVASRGSFADMRPTESNPSLRTVASGTNRSIEGTSLRSGLLTTQAAQ